MKKMIFVFSVMVLCVLLGKSVFPTLHCPCYHNHGEETCVCINDCPFKIQFLGCDKDSGPCP